MSQTFLVILALCSLSSSVLAQIPIKDDCPTFEECKTFDTANSVDKLNGTWYLFGGSQYFFDENARCDTINMTILPDNYVLINKNRYDVLAQKNTTFSLFGQYLPQNGSYKVHVGELQVPIAGEFIEINDNYYIWVACSDCGYFTKDRAGLSVYIYTKESNPSPTIVEEIFHKLEDCYIPTIGLIRVLHYGCHPGPVDGC